LSGFIEKRRLPRIEVRWPVVMETNKGLVKGQARNIAVDGVYIHFNDPMVEPALNEPFRLVIDTPQGKIGVVGKAVWSNLDILADLGFCFVDFSEKDRELLWKAIQMYAKK